MSGTIPFYDERLIAEIQFSGWGSLREFAELLAASLGVNSEEFRRQYLGEFKPEPYAYISAGYGPSIVCDPGKQDYSTRYVAIDPVHGDGLIVSIAGDSIIIIDEVDAALLEVCEGFGGCIVIDEPPQRKSTTEAAKLIASLCGYQQSIKVDDIPKPIAFEVDNWKRQRDYPTLKQGLRNPHFRKRHRR